MKTDTIDILARVTLEVLERYAFIISDPPSEDMGPDDFPSPLWMVLIGYRGPTRGAIGLAAPPALARQIAANLYGTERDEVSDEQAQDALKEFLNITCGDYLHEIEGNEPIFDLTSPALEPGAHELVMRHACAKPHATLNAEGLPLMVFIED